MAWLGKLLGGGIGYLFGGFWGAVIGVIAGHFLRDRWMAKAQARVMPGGVGSWPRQSPRPSGVSDDQTIFLVGLVGLAAKMAKVDGVVRRDEVQVLKAFLLESDVDQKKVAEVYNEAKRSHEGWEEYAEQLQARFSLRPAVLLQVLGLLYAVGAVDGKLSAREERFLLGVCDAFRVPRWMFERLRRQHDAARAEVRGQKPTEADDLAVLGLGAHASADEIKRRYRSLVRENHPDRLVAQGMPSEFVAQATERLKSVNAAYDRLRGRREA